MINTTINLLQNICLPMNPRWREKEEKKKKEKILNWIMLNKLKIKGTKKFIGQMYLHKKWIFRQIKKLWFQHLWIIIINLK